MLSTINIRIIIITAVKRAAIKTTVPAQLERNNNFKWSRRSTDTEHDGNKDDVGRD